jgi:hypothetical protein
LFIGRGDAVSVRRVRVHSVYLVCTVIVVTVVTVVTVGCGSEVPGVWPDAGFDAGKIQNPKPLDAAADHDTGTATLIGNADKLDLLFIVDNSTSMREEQLALRREFPRMIRKLVSGDHDGNGKLDHQPVTDLHIGVVSSNMGADSRVRGCEDLGDDGLLQHTANLAHDDALTCASDYPTFLGYTSGASKLDALSNDFGCIAALGTSGCGFEQHLESALKAVWPASQPELMFFGGTRLDATGHGDRENAGFLRRGTANAATLAVVAIADEDDCSSADRSIFRPDTDPDSGSPYYTQPLNLRCFYNHDKAFPLDRYMFGFQHLGSRRVVFAGIVGVPVDLVDATARAKVDFENSAPRNAYYDKILADPRMQETLNPQSSSGANPPTEIMPACTSALGRAFPARRFVELAKSFGQDSLIQSICGGNFDAPIDQVVERVSVPLE